MNDNSREREWVLKVVGTIVLATFGAGVLYTAANSQDSYPHIAMYCAVALFGWSTLIGGLIGIACLVYVRLSSDNH